MKANLLTLSTNFQPIRVESTALKELLVLIITILSLKLIRTTTMNLSRVNSVASFLPTKKLRELTSDQDYKITKLREIKIRFGKRIIAELNNDFSVFLPARIFKIFESDEKLYKDMMEAAQSGLLILKYIGGVYNKIEFKKG